jgi:iron complex outermembrane receptor protein
VRSPTPPSSSIGAPDYGTLTSITGYTDLTEDYYGDLDFCNPVDCPAGIFGLGPQRPGSASRRRAAEPGAALRVADDRDLRWIVGAFYINTKRDLETIGNFLFPGAPPFTFLASNESNDNDAYSVFAQVDYDFTDSTTLGVSLRYDKDEREQTDVSTGTCATSRSTRYIRARCCRTSSRTTSWAT